MRIAIDVAGKVATVKDGAKIVCGNSDYEIVFVFDGEWDADGVKTARFSYQRQGKALYQEQVFTGNVCPVPVLYDILEVRIGVYAGDLSTSTPAVVECERSILCGDPVHDEPPEDVYAQIVELCDEAVETAKSVKERADNGEFNGKDGANGKDAVIDQTFDPESENAQSGIAIEGRLQSKVLLDVTLTEEQAGASTVLLEIPNWQLLKKAKQWNVRITYTYTEADIGKSLWHNCTIKDKNVVRYTFAIANGYNVALTTSSNTVFWNIVVFNSRFEYLEGGNSYISFYQQPTPWSRVSAANSATAPRSNSYIAAQYCMTEDYPPYLEFQTGGITLEAGTRIYLEVIL